MEAVKIKDRQLVRDLSTNALLSTNVNELSEFNIRRRKILEEKKEKEETKQRLFKIEQDMLAIQNLLNELLLLRTRNGN